MLGGFLHTAVPHWTGRLPLPGTPRVPVSTRLAGRIAVFLSPSIGCAAPCRSTRHFLASLRRGLSQPHRGRPR
ncbi:NnrS family protein [Bradyrhizobium xenonodulans]|uniref:NnrS family protein n=1 Tax=Bradyrhizobium xenonodulans TaxID=2736875 RepID=A0ABY7N1T0_9BRAD|nr:NnrS family protein [Bradyrhizobium xenonodulans]WBL82772.1 NnrS family protein [Bradyrhizobium xenonodulans]